MIKYKKKNLKILLKSLSVMTVVKFAKHKQISITINNFTNITSMTWIKNTVKNARKIFQNDYFNDTQVCGRLFSPFYKNSPKLDFFTFLHTVPVVLWLICRHRQLENSTYMKVILRKTFLLLILFIIQNFNLRKCLDVFIFYYIKVTKIGTLYGK